MRDILIAVAAGLASAIAALSLVAGLPGAMILAYLAPLPLFAVGFYAEPDAQIGAVGSEGLRPMGIWRVIVASATGCVVAGALGGVASAGLYVVLHGVPATLAVRFALLHKSVHTDGQGETLAWYPPGNILAWFAALGALLLLAAGLFLPDTSGGDGGLNLPSDGLDSGLAHTVAGYLEAVFAAVAPDMDDAIRSDMVGILIPLFPGYAAASWTVMTAANAALAQGLLIRIGRAARPSPAYADLSLPGWTSWTLVAAAALGVSEPITNSLFGTGSGPSEWAYIGRNLAVVLTVPYFFLGLAVTHGMARRLKAPGMLLTAFYLILLFSGLTALLVVAGVGVIEQWIGLRRRMADGNGEQGE